MKNLCVLGATGSIGTQTLEVVRENPEDFRIVALTAGKNIELLYKQIIEFGPKYACLWEEADAKQLRKMLSGKDVTVYSGMEGLIACAAETECEIVVAAMVGMIGLQPVIAAMKAGKDIALANKETLVTAGHIIMPLANEYNVKILPVDSEHSAIFQCLQGIKGENALDKILLTASGGPFLNYSEQQLVEVTVEDALKHPNWAMGNKITIDSATMVNKGLEVLEAKWLFSVNLDQIEVVVQPKSIIHSMIQTVDGAVLAQLGTPDMKLPIQYALTYPERKYLAGERLDFRMLKEIEFREPPFDTLRGLKLAYEAGEEGGSMTTVMNAANEYAVARFLQKKISFLDIYHMIEWAMEHHKTVKAPSLEEILEIEKETYYKLEHQWR